MEKPLILDVPLPRKWSRGRCSHSFALHSRSEGINQAAFDCQKTTAERPSTKGGKTMKLRTFLIGAAAAAIACRALKFPSQATVPAGGDHNANLG